MNLCFTFLENCVADWRNSSGQPVAGIILLGRSFGGRRLLGVRVQVAVKLAQRFPSAKVVFSGMEEEAPAWGAQMRRRCFMAAGISPDRMVIEGQSRNTAENTVFCRAAVQPEKFSRRILVTSAFHMPRAIGAFRAAGFTVEAYPVEYLSASPSGATRVTAKEIMGLAYYRLTGHSDAWLLGP